MLRSLYIILKCLTFFLCVWDLVWNSSSVDGWWSLNGRAIAALRRHWRQTDGFKCEPPQEVSYIIQQWSMKMMKMFIINKVNSRFTPSQWETSLQSNAVSHWLGANLESALIKHVAKCSHYDYWYHINLEKSLQIIWKSGTYIEGLGVSIRWFSCRKKYQNWQIMNVSILDMVFLLETYWFFFCLFF